MGHQMLLDLLDLLCLRVQLRHQTNLGVQQRLDPSIHPTLLLTDLVERTKLFNKSAFYARNVPNLLIIA